MHNEASSHPVPPVPFHISTSKQKFMRIFLGLNFILKIELPNIRPGNNSSIRSINVYFQKAALHILLRII